MLILNHQPVSDRIPDGDLVRELRDDRGRFVFHPGVNVNTRARVQPIRQIVLHWTGGENPAINTARYLRDKAAKGNGLSVEFIVDKHGIIHQSADPLVTRCAHVGTPGNDHAIGVEITSRGFARPEDLQGEDLRERTEIDWAEPRDVYTDRIDGRRVRMVSYYPEQVQAVLWLVETLCGLLTIPRVVPWRRWLSSPEVPLPPHAVPYRDGHVVPAFDRDPARHARGRAASFEGVLGHFHVHPRKCDPGTQLFYALWQEGCNPGGVRRRGDLQPLG